MLEKKVFNIFGIKTIASLENQMWQALDDIAQRESCTVLELCLVTQIRKSKNTPIDRALAVFTTLYFKSRATEVGHRSAGHGNLLEGLSEEELDLFHLPNS